MNYLCRHVSVHQDLGFQWKMRHMKIHNCQVEYHWLVDGQRVVSLWFCCQSVALYSPTSITPFGHKPMDNTEWYMTSNCQLLLIMQYSCYQFIIFF
ncbi:hypothetical protein DB41_AY00010, partial [Neochlamydia sp. TUME1]|uniref:hypothetical protein n=1 Tax=Neochlamydia sp. TUME1 TaxID=1478174 RepID=UPI0005837B10